MANNLGDAIKIAVALQDLTGAGLRQLERNLRSIPSGMKIDVAMGDVKAIRNLRGHLTKAGKMAERLGSQLDTALGRGGKDGNALAGLVKGAQRAERNVQNVQKAIDGMNGALSKSAERRTMSRFGFLDSIGKTNAVAQMSAQMVKLEERMARAQNLASNVGGASTASANRLQTYINNTKAAYDQLGRMRERAIQIIAREEKAELRASERREKQQKRENRLGGNVQWRADMRGGALQRRVLKNNVYDAFKGLTAAQRGNAIGNVTRDAKNYFAMYRDAKKQFDAIPTGDYQRKRLADQTLREAEARFNDAQSLKHMMRNADKKISAKELSRSENQWRTKYNADRVLSQVNVREAIENFKGLKGADRATAMSKAANDVNLARAALNMEKARKVDASDAKGMAEQRRKMIELTDAYRNALRKKIEFNKADTAIRKADDRELARMQRRAERDEARAQRRAEATQRAIQKTRDASTLKSFKTSDFATQERAYQRVANLATQYAQKVSEAQKQLNNTPKDTKAFDAQLQAVKTLQQQYSRAEGMRKSMEQAMASTQRASERQALRDAERIQRGLDKIGGAFAGRREKGVLNAYRSSDAETRAKVMENLNARIVASNQKLLKAQKDLSTTTATGLALKQQQRYVNGLANEYNRLVGVREKMRAADKTLNMRANAQATRANAQAVRAYRQELNSVQVAMRNTSTFASQMREDLANAFGYYALKQFLSNVIEIGGQFEYQRRSIANILQDATKANVLFENIKQLGLKSPFSTLQLDQYAKQLTAFDIPYHELFEKLKKLADISAGTGADMSRIILAYGHVKSEGFLTGIQRRQFSNANINIVGGLSKLYSEREGQHVSVRDVYKRIHDKQVSFEDTDKVLMSLAEKGGMFYNMQEEMASSVKGVYKNLDDAVNHFYASVANSNNAFLMGIGQGLTKALSLAEKFPGTLTRIIGLLTVMAGLRALNARSIGAENAALVKKMVYLDKEQRRMNGGKARYASLSDRILGGAALSDSALQKHGVAMRNDAGLKAATLKAIEQRKLNRYAADYLRTMGAITAAEHKAAVTGRAWYMGMVRGLRSMGAALKGMLASFWPMLLIGAAFEGVMYLINKNSEAAERHKAAIQGLRDTYQSLKRAMEELPKGDFGTMDIQTRASAIKDMVTALRDNVGGAEVILSRIFAKDNSGNYLQNTVMQAEQVRKALEDAAAVVEKLSGGTLNSEQMDASGLKDNWEDFKEYEKNVNTALNTFLKGNTSAELKAVQAIVNSDAKLMAYMSKYDVKKNPAQYWAAVMQNEELVARLTKERVGRGQYAISPRFNSLLETVRDGVGMIGSNRVYQNLHDVNMDLHAQFKQWQTTLKNNGISGQEMHTAILQLIKSQQDMGEGWADYATALYARKYMGVTVPKGKVDTSTKNTLFEELEALQKKTLNSEPAKKGVRVPFTAEMDSQQMIETVKSHAKDAMGKLKDMGDLDLLEGMGVKVKDAKKWADVLKADYLERGNYGVDSAAYKQIEDYNKLVDTIKNADVVAKKLGIDLNEALKDKGSKGSGEDQWLKAMRERIERIKKAAEQYKQWSQVGGVEQAKARISKNDEFSGLFDDWKDVNLSDLRGLLEKELQKTGWDVTKEREKFKVQVASMVMSLDLDETKERLDMALDAMKKYVEDRKLEFDIYTKAYEATGDHNMAQWLAFGKDGSRQGYDKYLKGLFDAQMSQRHPDLTYDKASELSKEGWKSYGEDMHKFFQDIERDIAQWQQQQKQAYTTFLSEDNSYIAKRDRLYAKYQSDVEMLDRNKGTKADRARLDAKLDLDRQELLFGSNNFMDQLGGFNMEYITHQLEAYIQNLGNAYEAGAIAQETYNEKLQKAKKALDDVKNADAKGLGGNKELAKALRSGGIPAFVKKIEERYNSRFATDERGKYIYDETERGAREKDYEKLQKASNALGGFSTVVNIAKGALEGFSGAFNSLADMFDALGRNAAANDLRNIADGIDVGTSVLQPVSDVLGSVLNLDIGGVVSNAIQLPVKLFTSPITKAAELHDKKLTQKINRSKEALARLRHEYDLLAMEMERKFAVDNEDYTDQYDSLVNQQKELQKQYDLEKKKKNESDEALRDYEKQIAEVADKVKHYWADVLKELYGIDFKDYASRLTEALTGAFERGENAALAWKKTVGDIMRDLANEAIKTNIIAPMFDNLYSKYFGEEGQFRDTQMTEEDLKALGNDLMGLMDSTAMTNAESIYRLMQELFPYSGKGESSGGLSKIGQNITEETGGIIASYMNAIRADVSYNRKHLQTIVDKAIPTLEKSNVIANSQLTELKAITENTRNNAETAQQILHLLQSTTNGTKVFYMK